MCPDECLPATVYPWCLDQGNVVENLTALGLGPEAPEDGTTYKIQQLVKRSHSMHELPAGVRLLMECPGALTLLNNIMRVFP